MRNRPEMVSLGARLSVWLASAAIFTVAAAAQESTPSPVTPPSQPSVFVAAAKDYLWVAQVESKDGATTTQLAVRDKINPFVSRPALSRAVKLMAASGDELFAVFGDESLYRLSVDGTATAALTLPDGGGPLAIAASRAGLYAVVSSSVAAAIVPLQGESESEVEPARFDPGSSPLSLVLYDQTRWRALAGCPGEITEDASPALCAIDGGVQLFWIAADGSGIRSVTLQIAEPSAWTEQPPIDLPSPKALWPSMMDRNVTVTVRTGGDKPELHLFRRLGASWSRGDLRWTGDPLNLKTDELLGAAAFNQHLCLALRASDGEVKLRFGRLDGEPSEEPLVLRDVFTQPVLGPEVQFHTLMFFILIATFAALWLFRRSSMVAAVTLPGACELAFVSQRAVAWAIDLIPFTVAYAMILGVNWLSAMGELIKWAIDVDPNSGAVSQPNILRWWILSGSTYLLYVTAMELASRRTIGKMIMRLHLMSEAGGQVSARQVLARNVFRILELTPPLWALNFLALLTRNRQRLGDLFARTVVVRGAAPEQTSDTSGDAAGDDSAPSNDQTPPDAS